MSGVPKTLTDHQIALGEAWHCQHEGCPAGGTTRQRSGRVFYRHDCTGHHGRPEPLRQYIFCAEHAGTFIRTHGLSQPEPSTEDLAYSLYTRPTPARV